eukprot:TRINITY_DN18131_c0_g1_i1.p1 TRINITY_DN18131_c0_g1~~TRINITY_DN18131_c0_g1_i1.p1  ORF type:complete len:133 (-),score=12.90 TRINITY_DN18131_c0_g1_i1:315-713(-)
MFCSASTFHSALKTGQINKALYDPEPRDMQCLDSKDRHGSEILTVDQMSLGTNRPSHEYLQAIYFSERTVTAHIQPRLTRMSHYFDRAHDINNLNQQAKGSHMNSLKLADKMALHRSRNMELLHACYMGSCN